MRSPLVRGHLVPLSRQLAAGLEAAIRDGHLCPGTRLPSTRDLARRLDVDRGTVNAAYARLRRHGWVEGKPRGRLAVTEGAFDRPLHVGCAGVPVTHAGDLAADCVAALLGRAVATGARRHEVLAALTRVVSDLDGFAEFEAVEGATDLRPEPPRLSLLEPRPGLRRALKAELERRLGVPVVAARAISATVPGGPVLVRPRVLARLGSARFGRRATSRPVGLELVALPLAGGTRERGLVRRSVRGGVVAFLSASRTVRDFARELAAREFDRGVSFAAPDPRDTADVVRAVGVARLVLFDEASRDAVPPTTASTAAIRLIGSGLVTALRRYLGLDPPPRKTAVSSSSDPRAARRGT